MWNQLALALPLAQPLQGGTASFDWATTGTDCSLFACADLDGDGFDDLLTINGPRQVCVAFSVNGWKAAPWKAILENVPEGATALRASKNLVEFATPAGVRVYRFEGEKLVEAPGASLPPDPAPAPPSVIDLPVTPPPYELPQDPLLAPLRVFHGDLNGDGLADTLALFECKRPHPHRVVRAALALNPKSGDSDSDGLTDEEEAKLGTDPTNRDTDGDGLLDGWEVHGLPRGVEGPEDALDPRHQDFVVQVSVYEPLDLAVVQKEVARSRRLFAEMKTSNPDGTSGIRLHYRWLPKLSKEGQGNAFWGDVGNRVIPEACRGLMHWMQVTPGGGGQSQELGDMGGSGNHWAAFAHEVGHQLGLSHTGDSAPAWCPLYTSLMNYAFNYSFEDDGEKIHFSDGRFAKIELRETALDEHLPFPYKDLAYLAKGPFHFHVEDDLSGGTWVDWNHDGKRDMALVTADVNYGGSTYCGVRHDVAKVGAAPSLVRVGEVIYLVTLDETRTEVSIRAYEGNEKWGEPRVIPNSASEEDPVAVGTADGAYVFLKRPGEWRIAHFDGASVQAPGPARERSGEDLSAALVGDRILCVFRHDDGHLETQWFRTGPGSVSWTPGPTLDFRSQVPVAFVADPATHRIVMVGAGDKPNRGRLCLKVAWFEPRSDTSWERVEERWVGGADEAVHCSTRPVVRFGPDGRLLIFHTGWPDDAGEMTAWRTQMLPTRELHDGWLICLLYDVWTRTRCSVAWEIGPQGAVYAYRWDAAGEKNKLQTAFNGLGIDAEPMRDFDDGALVSKWGIRHSILNMRR